MSARQLSRLVRRRWWLILAPAVVLTALVGGWANRQTDVYVSEGSYVVRVSVENESDLVRATAALTDTDEIVSTYAGIVRSALIAERAHERLGLTDTEARAVTVTSAVVQDANILLIGARSRDPRLALDMADAVGDLSATYIRRRGDSFLLAVLDAPELPVAPTSRQVVPLMAGGALLGLAAGYALAVASERLKPVEPVRRRVWGIVDDRSRAHSKRYLRMRLREELTRSRREGRTFCVGVLQVLRFRPRSAESEEAARLTDEELTAVVEGVKGTLRDQDLLGYLGRGRFAAILPNRDLEEARALVQQWRRTASPTVLSDRRGRDLMVRVAACEFDLSGFVGDPDAELVVSAL